MIVGCGVYKVDGSFCSSPMYTLLFTGLPSGAGHLVSGVGWILLVWDLFLIPLYLSGHVVWSCQWYRGGGGFRLCLVRS